MNTAPSPAKVADPTNPGQDNSNDPGSNLSLPIPTSNGGVCLPSLSRSLRIDSPRICSGLCIEFGIPTYRPQA